MTDLVVLTKSWRLLYRFSVIPAAAPASPLSQTPPARARAPQATQSRAQTAIPASPPAPAAPAPDKPAKPIHAIPLPEPSAHPQTQSSSAWEATAASPTPVIEHHDPSRQITSRLDKPRLRLRHIFPEEQQRTVPAGPLPPHKQIPVAHMVRLQYHRRGRRFHPVFSRIPSQTPAAPAHPRDVPLAARLHKRRSH